MAVSFVAAGTAKKVGSGDAAAVALPTGYATGDALLLVCSTADNVASTVATAGWSALITPTAAGTSLEQSLFYKVAASTSETAPTVTHTSGDSIVTQILAWRGGATSGNPFDVVGVPTATATASTTASAASITTLVSGAAVIFLVSGGISTGTSTPMTVSGYSGTTPTFTEVADNECGLGLKEAGIATAWGTLAAAGATGAKTATLVASGQSVGTLLSLPPVAATATVRPGLPNRRFWRAAHRSANI